jgi:hypothetical protein
MAIHNVLRLGSNGSKNKLYKICDEHIAGVQGAYPDWEAVRNCPECRCMGDEEDVSDADIMADDEPADADSGEDEAAALRLRIKAQDIS